MSKQVDGDFMFAPDVLEAYVERFDRTVYWLNGDFKQHNELMKMISDENKRQIGWENAVYVFACNKDGSRLFDKMSKTEFHQKVNHAWARIYGGLIVGIGEGDEKNTFDLEADELAKKSEKTKQATST